MQTIETSGLINLLKENMKLRAEVTTLVDILRASELTERVPDDWYARLKLARSTERYQSIVREYDEQFTQLGHAKSREDIDAVLHHIPMMRFSE